MGKTSFDKIVDLGECKFEGHFKFDGKSIGTWGKNCGTSCPLQVV